MDTTSGKEVSYVQLIPCGKVQRALIPMENCKRCEFHRGIEKVFEGGNGLLEQYDVMCALPVRIRASNYIEEGINGGSE